MAHVLGLSTASLLAHENDELAPEARNRFYAALSRRSQGEPVPYIIGTREFFGLRLTVTPDTLIPRPETELIVQTALDFAAGLAEPPRILDVCTGSGAIAIALAVNLPSARITAADISSGALRMARLNARAHGVAINAVQSDLLHGLAGLFDIITANPPYIPSANIAHLPATIRDFEPRLALDGGRSGLDVLARLLAQAPGHLAPGGALVSEIQFDQGWSAAALARQAFPEARVQILRDLAGHDRCLLVRR